MSNAKQSDALSIVPPEQRHMLKSFKSPNFSTMAKRSIYSVGESMRLKRGAGIDIAAIREAWKQEAKRASKEVISAKTLGALMFESWKLPMTDRGRKAMMLNCREWIDFGFPLIPNLNSLLDS